MLSTAARVLTLNADMPSRSDVRLEFDTAAMRVTGKGESKDDVPKVQQTMESDKVLDVARYPRITFESTGVTAKRRDGGALEADIAGRLTIRDVMQTVTAPVHVDFGDGVLTATGRLTVKQSAFGIKPISIAGVVSVKDALDITFVVVAPR